MLSFLLMIHVLGTALGVGGATFIEIFFLKIQKTGQYGEVERSFLRAVYWTMRVALALLIISGWLLVAYMFHVQDRSWIIASPDLWVKNAIVLFIIVNSILLAVRMIPFWLGAALSISSWYVAMALGVWRDIPFSFVELMLGFAFAVAVAAVVLRIIKYLYLARWRVA